MSKKAKTETKTQVQTTTSTTLRDIGLTGAQAVDLASVLESGSIARTQISADLVESVLQTVGGSYQALAGGAGKLTQTAGQVTEAAAEVAIAQTAKAPETKSLEKMVPFIALALVGVVYMARKA